MKSVWMLSLLVLASVAHANGRPVPVEPKPSYIFRNVCYGEQGKNFSQTTEFRVYADHRIMALRKNGFQQYFGHSNFDTFLRHMNVCQPINQPTKSRVDAAVEFHKRERALALIRKAQMRADAEATCSDIHRTCSRSINYKTRYSPGTVADNRSAGVSTRLHQVVSGIGTSTLNNVPGAQ